MPTIKVYVTARYSNKTHADLIEIPDDTWNSWSEEQQHQVMHQLAENFMDANVDYGAYVIEAQSE